MLQRLFALVLVATLASGCNRTSRSSVAIAPPELVMVLKCEVSFQDRLSVLEGTAATSTQDALEAIRERKDLKPFAWPKKQEQKPAPDIVFTFYSEPKEGGKRTNKSQYEVWEHIGGVMCFSNGTGLTLDDAALAAVTRLASENTKK